MCQLTFADLGKLNPKYLTIQLILNSLDNNPDGTGICSHGMHWKTNLNASLTNNLGECVKGIVTDEPVIGHVRLASDKTLKLDEHSHPFKGSLVVQAHNGKLVPKEDALLPLNMVDSAGFMNHLELLWKTHAKLSFPDVLKKTMENWEGKFAFMYNTNKGKDYYIVRGKTANLFWSTVNGKLVVNTERKTLNLALATLDQLYQLTHVRPLNITPIEEVEKESIFKFDYANSELVKVGEIEENTVATKVITTTVARPYIGLTSEVNVANRLEELMFTNNLSLEDTESLSQTVFACSLLELNTSELTSFNEDVLTKLALQITPHKEEIWKAIRLAGKGKEAYTTGTVFPWMFSTIDALERKAEGLGVVV